jgi:flagellar protein FlaG
MEIMQTTAKMQQSQTQSPRSNAVEMQKAQMVQEKAAPSDTQSKPSKVESQKDLEDLVMRLNRSLNPFNTSLRFGFDNSSEDFYVSVIDTKTNDMLRRFPAEEAEQILPKIQEINGLLFDRKA